MWRFSRRKVRPEGPVGPGADRRTQVTRGTGHPQHTACTTFHTRGAPWKNQINQLFLQDAVNAIVCRTQCGGNGFAGEPCGLDLSDKTKVRMCIGVKEDAENRGGMNLFGSKFGNHTRDVLLRAELEGQE